MANTLTTFKPTIVCLCGSTRFYQQFQRANFLETLKGHIVLSVGFYMHANDIVHGGELHITQQDKLRLDELHLRKIDLCDEVLVININGYIGASTKRELWYAIHHGKHIRFYDEEHRVPLPEIKQWFRDVNEWAEARDLAATTTPTDQR